MGMGPDIREIRRRLHEADVAKAQIKLQLEMLSPEEEVQTTLKDVLNNAYQSLYCLSEIIENIHV